MNQRPSSEDSYSVDNKFCRVCRAWRFITVTIAVLCNANTKCIHQAKYTIMSQTMLSLIHHHHAQNSPSLDPFWSTCIQATSITPYSHHQYFQYFFWVISFLPNHQLNYVHKFLTVQFYHPVTSPPSGPNILLGILFWNYLRKYSSPCSERHFTNIWDERHKVRVLQIHCKESDQAVTFTVIFQTSQWPQTFSETNTEAFSAPTFILMIINTYFNLNRTTRINYICCSCSRSWTLIFNCRDITANCKFS